MDKKNKNIQNLWNNFKWFNLHITRIPEGQERDKGEEKTLVVKVTENF